MCGRFSLFSDIDELGMRFDAEWGSLHISARYNIAPGTDCPVVVEEGPRSIRLMRWGLVPGWAKDPKIGYRMINARAETLDEKPSFTHILEHRRCLVPADGFYEWTRGPGGKGRLPWHLRLKGGGTFAFAGLWDRWVQPGGEPLETFTIITTAPNALVSRIHDRMPAILTPASEALWLSGEGGDTAALKGLLLPYDPDGMEMYRVSTMVNSTGNDSPGCVEEVGE